MSAIERVAVDHLISHRVIQVIDKPHLRTRLLRGDRLRVKLGMDPTAPDLHLGHAVLLRKLREFQNLGHAVILIVGDATARVGDPSGRSKTRPALDVEEIQKNTTTYVQQLRRFLDVDRAEIRYNSEWLDHLSFNDFLRLLGSVTVARMLERDDFAKRLKAGLPIGLHEVVYPLLQAFDSVSVRADVELGGTDQTFNLLVGRDLQVRTGQAPQDILTTPLLVGLDGREKMSKSLGNHVGVLEAPTEMIGKLMTIPDEVIGHYAALAADWPEEKVKKLPGRLKNENPRDVKLEVARDVVALYQGTSAAKKAAAEWLKTFHDKQLPSSVPKKKLKPGSWNVVDLLVVAGLAASKSDARRLVAQGGVRLNSARVSPKAKTVTIKTGDILQTGKRKFVKIA